MVGAFSRVLVKRSPKPLQTDRGKEFLNALFQKFLKSKNIIFLRLTTMRPKRALSSDLIEL